MTTNPLTPPPSRPPFRFDRGQRFNGFFLFLTPSLTLSCSYLENKDKADPLVISVVGVPAVVVWPKSLHREVHPLLTLKSKLEVRAGLV